MKKSLLLLSSLFILSGVSTVQAQTADELKEQAQQQMQELNETLNELRKAYGDDAMKVGDTITFDSGLIITLNDAEITTPDEYDFEEVTGTMVRFDITVDNQTSESLSVSAHDFDLYDGDRVATEHLSKDFFSADIASGMKAEGSIYYDLQNIGTITFIVGAGTWSVEI